MMKGEKFSLSEGKGEERNLCLDPGLADIHPHE
jgi:hypothetical protein